MKKQKEKNLQETLKFDDKGLIPAVVQDDKDGTVLMVAYMNRESVRRTLKLKKSVFWSRSRQSFWLKGESSGNIQKVKELRIDCDGDCLVVKVEQIGKAACHTGHRSCFYRKVMPSGKLHVTSKPVFDPKKVYHQHDQPKADRFADGHRLRLRKRGEGGH